MNLYYDGFVYIFLPEVIISATEYPLIIIGRDLSGVFCVYEEYSTITALSSGFGVTKQIWYHPS
jgi:hypothetical protein